jgi:hypothetical protein
MDELDYWRLCDEVSVVQAALLFVGEDPSERQGYIENEPPKNRPRGYDAVRAALVNAIRGDRLSAKIIRVADQFGNDGIDGIDWYQTTVLVEDLRTWLKSRGVTTGFFFPIEEEGPDYLSSSHDHFSPKLAAAIKAWLAITSDPELRRGKTVKQAIIVWLRQHANEFGLTKEDGNPNEQGIEEVAKIANWDMKGGAPKTPGTK